MTKEEQAQMLVKVANMISKMGWSIAIPDQDFLGHILMGDAEELEKLIKDLPYHYDIMTKRLGS